MASYFVLEGVTPAEVAAEMRANGWEPQFDVTRKYMAVAALVMGWSWSVFLAERTLQDVMEGPERLWSDSSRLQYGRAPPQLSKWDAMHWVCVDGFGELRRQAPGEQALTVADQRLEAARRLLQGVELSSHKEKVAIDLPAAMGITIKDFVLSVLKVKF